MKYVKYQNDTINLSQVNFINGSIYPATLVFNFSGGVKHFNFKNAEECKLAYEKIIEFLEDKKTFLEL